MTYFPTRIRKPILAIVHILLHLKLVRPVLRSNCMPSVSVPSSAVTCPHANGDQYRVRETSWNNLDVKDCPANDRHSRVPRGRQPCSLIHVDIQAIIRVIYQLFAL